VCCAAGLIRPPARDGAPCLFQVERRKRAAVATDMAAFTATVTGEPAAGGGKGGGAANGAAAAANGAAFGPPEEHVPGAGAADGAADGADLDAGPDQGSAFEDYLPGRERPAAAGKAAAAAAAAPAAAARDQAPKGGAARSGRGRAWLRDLFSAEAMREPAPTLVAGNGGAAAPPPPAGRPGAPGPNTRYWVASVMKLLITHLQLLGLLRGLRVNWPEAVNGALIFFDQTSTVSSWVSLDCSLSDSDSGGLRRSIKRTVLLLMLPGERRRGPGMGRRRKERAQPLGMA
jgi:hypothetical protein